MPLSLKQLCSAVLLLVALSLLCISPSVGLAVTHQLTPPIPYAVFEVPTTGLLIVSASSGGVFAVNATTGARKTLALPNECIIGYEIHSTAPYTSFLVACSNTVLQITPNGNTALTDRFTCDTPRSVFNRTVDSILFIACQNTGVIKFNGNTFSTVIPLSTCGSPVSLSGDPSMWLLYIACSTSGVLGILGTKQTVGVIADSTMCPSANSVSFSLTSRNLYMACASISGNALVMPSSGPITTIIGQSVCSQPFAVRATVGNTVALTCESSFGTAYTTDGSAAYTLLSTQANCNFPSMAIQSNLSPVQSFIACNDRLVFKNSTSGPAVYDLTPRGCVTPGSVYYSNRQKRVYIACQGNSYVLEIDDASGLITQSISVCPNGGTPAHVTGNENDGILYVSCQSGGVYTFQRSGSGAPLVASLYVTAAQCIVAQSLAYSTSTGDVAIACGNYISIFYAGVTTTNFPQVQCSNAVSVAFNSAGLLFATCNNVAVQLNVTTLITSSIPALTQCSAPTGIVVNPLTQDIIVTCPTSGVFTVNPTGSKLIVNLGDCASPQTAAVSPVTGSVYVSCPGTSASFIVRVDSSQSRGFTALTTTAQCNYPTSLAVNSYGQVIASCKNSNSASLIGQVSSFIFLDSNNNVLGLSATLSPPFQYDIYTYTLNIPSNMLPVTSFSIRAIYDNSALQISANINGKNQTTLLNNVTSPALPISILPGGQINLITITAFDAVYQISVPLSSLVTVSLTAIDSNQTPLFDLVSTTSKPFSWTSFRYDSIHDPRFIFPVALRLNASIAFGSVTADYNGQFSTSRQQVPNNQFINFQLDTSSTNPYRNYTITLSTMNGPYTFSFHNPCGFLPGSVGGPGSLCASHPISSCLAGGQELAYCTPYLHPLSFRSTPAQSSRSVDLPTSRSIVLPQFDSFGVSVMFDMYPGSLQIPVGLRPYLLAPFDMFVGSLISNFTVHSPPFQCTQLMPTAISDPTTNVTVVCDLPGNVTGSSYYIQLSTCLDPFHGTNYQCISFSGSDTFSSPPPGFVPFTLTRVSPVFGQLSPTGDLLALQAEETLTFSVNNVTPDPAVTTVLFGVIADLRRALRAAYNNSSFNATSTSGDRLPSASIGQLRSVLYECTINLGRSSGSLLACTTPNANAARQLTGQRLRFLLIVGGQWNISSDTYSFPVTPLISRLTSTACEDDDRATRNCPTAGNVTITLIGSGFSQDGFVLVGGANCPIVALNTLGTEIVCTLPAGAGSLVSCAVSSYGYFSPQVPYLSYADPTINVIASSGCTTVSNLQLTDCTRIPGNATTRLQLSGINFGPLSPSIFVGSVLCQPDLAGSPPINTRDAHTTASCFLPAGKGLNQPVVLIQQNGKISQTAAIVSYQQCQAGEYDPYPNIATALDCESCDFGHYSSTLGSSTCLPCPAGRFADQQNAQNCSACVERTFQDTQGQSHCNACEFGSYQPNTGSSSCFSCPSNLFLDSTAATASATDCADAPNGARSDGKMLLNKADYYLAEDANGKLATFLCPPGLCVDCADSTLDAMIVDGNSTSPAAMGNNIYTTNQTVSGVMLRQCCGPHRMGNSYLCSECEPKYVEFNSVCQRCEKSNGGLVTLFLVLSFLVTIWLIRSSSTNNSGSVGVLLYFIQTAMLQIGSGTKLQILAWLRIVNFNPSYLASTNSDADCVAKLSPYDQVLLSLFVPVILTGEMLLVAIIQRVSSVVVSGPSSPTINENAGICDKISHGFRSWCTTFQSSIYVDSFLSILLFSYTETSSTCFKYLFCVDVLGQRLVFSSPSMNCGSGQYQAILIPVILFLIVFTFGFPLAVWLIGFRMHRRGEVAKINLASSSDSDTAMEPKVDDASKPIGWRPLFAMYRSSAWYFTPIVLCRRSLFVVLDVFLSDALAFRNMSFVLANLASMLLLQAIRPFHWTLINQMEIGSHVLLLTMAAIMTAQLPPFSDGVQALLFILCVPPLLVYVLLLVMYRKSDPTFESGDALALASAAASSIDTSEGNGKSEKYAASSPPPSLEMGELTTVVRDGSVQPQPASPSHVQTEMTVLPPDVQRSDHDSTEL